MTLETAARFAATPSEDAVGQAYSEEMDMTQTTPAQVREEVVDLLGSLGSRDLRSIRSLGTINTVA
jgi:hypothetical protein